MRVLKCLDHDEIIRLRIFMSKDVDLSNMLISVVHESIYRERETCGEKRCV